LSLPRLLLVDDSEAILAFETAVLSAHYSLAKASNGRQALERMRQAPPDGVLLDLSMPELDGEGVIAAMRADPLLAHVPVVVVSSEAARAEALVGHGAEACVIKPIRGEVLRATVARVLDASAERIRTRSFACLFVEVGPHTLAFPLAAVRSVLPELATRPLPPGPRHLRESFELDGRPVLVVDLATLFEVESKVPRLDRALVVMTHGSLELAFRVDRVRDPEELSLDDVVWRAQLGGAEQRALRDALLAVVMRDVGFVPVLASEALLDPEAMEALPALFAALQTDGAAR
jgi:CheY-like chemotaxis protein/chemotaxis signal transduction protein